uniref:UPAR/Ly6 domain-containing protein n=1 Tax=Panagrolaimus sp. PS1159 TaxID=55785 RepID=A0AC35FI06_9BILA
MHFLTVLALFGSVSIVLSKITCYRGINIIMPGNANFSQSMASLGCNNADYCLRAFGTFNGQNGWFSTCGSNDTCSSYPACTTVTGGAGNYSTSYTSCCCKTDKCNELSFTGEKDNGSSTTQPTPTTSSSVMPTINSLTLLIFSVLSFIN